MCLPENKKAGTKRFEKILKQSVLLLTISLVIPLIASAGMNGTARFDDKVQRAHRIQNPGTMEGRLEVSDSAGGRGDDYYRISLSKGDSISLSIDEYLEANKSSVDLDLYLLNADGKVVASSVGDGKYETISNVAFPGDYVLNVHAEAGTSEYNLEVGGPAAEGDADTLSSTQEYIPGEVIVRFRDRNDGSTSGKGLRDRISSLGMRFKSGKPGKELLAAMDLDEKDSMFQSIGISEDRASLRAVDSDTQERLDTLLAIKALRKRSDVISADPNYVVQLIYPASIPNDTYYDSYQWNLEMMELEDAWDVTTGSSNVVVAVVDTGALFSHPDLYGKLTDDGYDFISDTSISNDGDGIDEDPEDPGDSTVAGEASFHGTHVSGIIGAKSNNNLGVAGVGFSTMIMPVRVLGIDGGTSYDVLQGIRYAAGLSNDSGAVPGKAADIINLSLGSSYYSSAEASVYEEIRDAGVIVVAAAGNDASRSPLYPAAYNSVISVAAVGSDGDRASYSNYGGYVDVAAPGGDIYGDATGYILSTGGDLTHSGDIELGYVWMAGTSMASPHVAGVAALMKAVDSGMTPDDFEDYLRSGEITDDFSDTSLYSYGLINAYKAVTVAGGSDDGDGSNDGDDGDDGETGSLTVSPASFDFGSTTTEATLTLSSSGSGKVSVAQVSNDARWLRVSERSVDGDGLGTYTVRVSRSFMFPGTYSATITIVSDLNTETVPVSMSVKWGGGRPGGPGGGPPGRW